MSNRSIYNQFHALEVTVEASIATVRLNNPPVNAVSAPMHAELETVWAVLEADEAVSVVILTGAGKRAFSAGGDIDHMQTLIESPQLMVAEMAQARRLLVALLDFGKPTIARVNGHAIGLGATLALSCDLIFAATGVKFGDPHVSVGLVAGDGGSLLWPLAIGYPRAREHLLTGDPILSEDAAGLGMINRAVPLDKLDSECNAIARRLADGPTRAIGLTKKAINLKLLQDLMSVIDAHLGYEFMSNTTDEHREAVAAFLEKRKPAFK